MARVASLGMYDPPAVHAANDALWAAIADRLIASGARDVPSLLDRTRTLPDIWDDPALLLAQCCGYPLATTWQGRLRYVATPRYAVTGCEGSDYRSRIVIRRDDPARSIADLRGREAVINDRSSNSGMNMFRALLAPLAGGRPFFSSVTETGSHAESARMVARGAADIAAIDAVTHAHLLRDEPDTVRRLRTIGWTNASPGLPLVTSVTTTPRGLALLRRALRQVEEDAALAPVRAALLLDGFDILPPARYRTLLKVEAIAMRAGYPVLA